MSEPLPESDHATDERDQQIVADIARQGWCVVPAFLPQRAVSELRILAQAAWRDEQFRHAGVGRGEDFAIQPEVRTDQVMWLDPVSHEAGLRDYFAALEKLRLTLNQTLYLGLHDFEAHLAIYPPGSFYKKHLDQFRGIGLRTLTTTLYLNNNWQPQDGGQLRLYHNPQAPAEFIDILPEAGTLVCFLSADFLHEVLISTRERYSLTGWFRQRSV